jgi:hypothetical protein
LMAAILFSWASCVSRYQAQKTARNNNNWGSNCNSRHADIFKKYTSWHIDVVTATVVTVVTAVSVQQQTVTTVVTEVTISVDMGDSG